MTVARALMSGKSLDYAVRSLFAAGEKGVWYDPSDLSTVFSDVAGTTAATVNGAVGKILDKSGNGFHATAAADNTTRPTLRQSGSLYYLEFDGSNDAMSTPSIDMTGTDKLTAFAAMRKTSDPNLFALIEFSADSNTNNGTFIMFEYAPATFRLGWNTKGTTKASTDVCTSSSTYAAPVTAVMTGISDIGAPVRTLRLNGSQVSSKTETMGSGNLGNYPLYIGAQNLTANFFPGYLYGLIVRGASSTATQIASGERWCGTKCGIRI